MEEHVYMPPWVCLEEGRNSSCPVCLLCDAEKDQWTCVCVCFKCNHCDLGEKFVRDGGLLLRTLLEVASVEVLGFSLLCSLRGVVFNYIFK